MPDFFFHFLYVYIFLLTTLCLLSSSSTPFWLSCSSHPLGTSSSQLLPTVVPSLQGAAAQLSTANFCNVMGIHSNVLPVWLWLGVGSWFNLPRGRCGEELLHSVWCADWLGRVVVFWDIVPLCMSLFKRTHRGFTPGLQTILTGWLFFLHHWYYDRGLGRGA